MKNAKWKFSLHISQNICKANIDFFILIIFAEYVRKINGMNLLYVKEKSMGNMEKALISGLPNEVDFAMNVCTLLANEGKSVFNLQHGAVVLELLLAHVGIFHEGKNIFNLKNL